MEQDKGSSYQQYHPVPVEGLLVHQIGWGLRERKWWRYSDGPTVFNTFSVIFWDQEKIRECKKEEPQGKM